MIDFADAPLFAIFAVSVGVVLIAAEAGHLLGRKTLIQRSANVSTLEAAILGLLALMISFTFSMALSRFETRREAVVAEANAIGTAALRARLLAPPTDKECLALLREYVEVRLAIPDDNPSARDLATAIEQSNALQDALWKKTIQLVANDRDRPLFTSLFIQSLNHMIDLQTARLVASRNRVPGIVLMTLYALAALAIAFAGYAAGLEQRRWRPAVYITGLLVATVICLIQDLDRPRSGYITVSLQPLSDLASTLARYKE